MRERPGSAAVRLEHAIGRVSRLRALQPASVEVCYAYIVNDSLLARVPYYQVGRQPVLGPLALTRLESRYYGQARLFLLEQTKHWLRRLDVSVPDIRIVGPVTVSANLGMATITTVETWMVRAEPSAGSPSGRVLFAETGARHTIWLDRTPTILCLAGHCLHNGSSCGSGSSVLVILKLRKSSANGCGSAGVKG